MTDVQERYIQLNEIRRQLYFLRERKLHQALVERLEELWNSFTSQEHKEIALALYREVGE